MRCSDCQSELTAIELAAIAESGDAPAAITCARCTNQSSDPQTTKHRATPARKTRPELVLLTLEETQNIERAGLSDPPLRKGRPSPALPPKPSTVPKPKRKQKRRPVQEAINSPSQPPQQSNSPASKKSTEHQHEQSVTSARSVARAWTQSVSEAESKSGPASDSGPKENSVEQKPKFRIDAAHAPHQTQRDSRPDDSDALHQMRRLDPHRDSISTARRAITFGLLIFMLGQIGVQWGFFASHFPAWSIGTLFSIGGLAIAFLSVTECFKRVERQLQNSGRTGSRSKVKRSRKRKSKRRS